MERLPKLPFLEEKKKKEKKGNMLSLSVMDLFNSPPETRFLILTRGSLKAPKVQLVKCMYIHMYEYFNNTLRPERPGLEVQERKRERG